MDVILKVLEGAKTGTKIAIKKERFLIGRSQQCNLCAGSSSISRQHCVIKRSDTQVSIKDLGSRNGTVVNGKKITHEVEIKSGDEIGIGTLKLVVTISHGINNLKRPKVNSVAEAVDRTASASSSTLAEDDITKWLLDAPGSSSSGMDAGSIAASETQTMRMDDTNAVHFKSITRRVDEAVVDEAAAESTDEKEKQTQDKHEDETADSSTGKPGKSKKKEPGKLPKLPSKPGSKDSREAAINALRNWNRRH